MDRRTLLKAITPTSLVLAGCASESDTTSTSSTTTVTTTTTTTTTPDQTSREKTTDSQTTETTTNTKQKSTTAERSAPDHPSANGVFDEPTRGPTPFSADTTLVAFEDPSCPNCVHFEKNVYPKLKRNHIDSGNLSFVLRTIPTVDQWGVKAIHALEVTYAQDKQAFWDLKNFYFMNQDQFKADNVLSKTKKFIDQETKLDGKNIVRDTQSKTQKSQWQEDLSVAKSANVQGTPTFFAFRSEEFITEIVGSQSYSIFKNVLGL